MVEQRTVNPRVTGSIPVLPAKFEGEIMTSGQCKFRRSVYSAGSGNLNLNNSEQDSDVDPIRELRWDHFQREFSNLPLEERKLRFKQKFNYS